ncbi:MAG: hypothetical protein JWM27_4340, partial [Gemmatimonadetes bacterium]|nr:hypothetical protein [Gemmatimonadota bacterium]
MSVDAEPRPAAAMAGGGAQVPRPWQLLAVSAHDAAGLEAATDGLA